MSEVRTLSGVEGSVTKYFYNEVGNRDSVHNANGTSTGYTYDNLNRLTNVTNFAPDLSVISSYQYELNNAGIRTSATESDGSRVEYNYDDCYKLTGETRSGNHAYAITFTYDNVGNRLTQVRDGVTKSYTYNNRDQLTQEDSAAVITTYVYDPAGRMLNKTVAGNTTTYGWEDNDRMISVTGPGVSVTYTYDHNELRVSEISATDTTHYLIDYRLPYGQVVADFDENGDVKASYIYGLERINMDRSGSVFTYVADGQGSIRNLTNSSGNVTDSYYYTVFGEQLAKTGTTENRFMYVGEQWDVNAGFYYNRARWMDPSTGRFVSVDPYKGKVGIPISLHSYLYSKQSSLNYSDPSGKLFEFQTLSINTTIENTIRAAAQAEYMGLIKYLIIKQAIGSIIVAGAAVEVGWDIYKQQKWINDAKKEPPLRLRHYTTEKGMVLIEGAGVIKNPSGNGNYFTPDQYDESALAADRLATYNEPDFYIELNMFKSADKLNGPSQIAPHTYISEDGIRIRNGGGREYITEQPIFINSLLRVRSPWIPLTK
jgi:RHS repeat-associated protein